MSDVRARKQRSIEPVVFRCDPPALLGGFSPSSGQFHFPLQVVCPYTGADDVVPKTLSTVGTVWGWTVVTAAPPGYVGDVPYGFGVVELAEEQLRVITRLRITAIEELQFGDRVRLCADTTSTDDDGTDVVVWAFEKDPS